MRLDEFRVLHGGGGEPQVTIVVPVRNQRRFVADAIASLLAQRDSVCEILISDDASTDGTATLIPEVVHALAGGRAVPHTVMFRAGSVRLGRDHLHALAGVARTDLVIQAHGDDLSDPHRAEMVSAVAAATGASMVACAARRVDEHGAPIDDTSAAVEEVANPSARLTDLAEVLSMPVWLAGATMAWRPSDLEHFEPLTQRRVPTSHDRIMGVRAVLAGGLAVIDEPLVTKRVHPDQWSAVTVDRLSRTTAAYGWSVARLTMLEQCEADVTAAVAAGRLDPMAADAAREQFADMRARNLDRLRRSAGELTAAHLVPVWVPEDEARRLPGER